MRTRYWSVVFVLVAWGWCGPTPWTGAARAQGTLMDTTGNVSAPLAQNPRGPTFFAQAQTITLTAGQSYTIRMTPTTVGDDSYIYLLGPNGAVVGQDDDGDMSFQIWASKLTVTVQATGTYTIICTTFSPQRAFGYRLIVTGPPNQPMPPAAPVGPGIPNVRLTPAPAWPELVPAAFRTAV